MTDLLGYPILSEQEIIAWINCARCVSEGPVWDDVQMLRALATIRHYQGEHKAKMSENKHPRCGICDGCRHADMDDEDYECLHRGHWWFNESPDYGYAVQHTVYGPYGEIICEDVTVEHGRLIVDAVNAYLDKKSATVEEIREIPFRKFPERCPFCSAAARKKQHVPTLGNQVTYWCGRKLNDNGGEVSGDWTRCDAWNHSSLEQME